MIELPEAMVLAGQLNETISGKLVSCVYPPAKPHKFCWFNGSPEAYEEKITAARVSDASAFGIYVELSFDNGYRLCVNDGVNVRLVSAADKPKNYQLLIEFTDGAALVFTVAMYGGIVLHDGSYDNDYYIKSRSSVSPLTAGFGDYYRLRLA